MKKEIFGINFDNLTMDEVLDKIKGFVVLPYSEFVVRAQKDKEFKKILNSADFCLCESHGLWLATQFSGKKLKQPINGIELIKKIGKQAKIKNQKIFLLGGDKNVVEKTAKKIGDGVVGYENGYGDLNKTINKINKIKPDILLVALGSPKQEKWIYENLKKMPSVKIAIGVGGAFNFISGKIKRAPKFLQKAGLEWLWRLMIEPKRLKRIFLGVSGLIWLTIKKK